MEGYVVPGQRRVSQLVYINKSERLRVCVCVCVFVRLFVLSFRRRFGSDPDEIFAGDFLGF